MEQMPVLDTQWGQIIRVWSRESFITEPCKKMHGSCPRKNPEISEGFQQSILQAKWGRGVVQFSSVQSLRLSCVEFLWPHGLHYSSVPCPSPMPGACSNSCPSRWWRHPTISSSVVPISSYLQSFPASGSFPMSQFFASCGQSIRVSASASVLPMNIQDWFPLGWTDWISLQSKGLSRVFNTTVQKHPFFGTQLPL